MGYQLWTGYVFKVFVFSKSRRLPKAEILSDINLVDVSEGRNNNFKNNKNEKQTIHYLRVVHFVFYYSVKSTK